MEWLPIAEDTPRYVPLLLGYQSPDEYHMSLDDKIIDLAAVRAKRAAEQKSPLRPEAQPIGAQDEQVSIGFLTGLNRPAPTQAQLAARIEPKIVGKAGMPQPTPELLRRLETMPLSQGDAERKIVLDKIKRLHNIGFIVVPQYVPIYYQPLEPFVGPLEEAVGRISRDMGGDDALRKKIGLINVYLHQDRMLWQITKSVDYEFFIPDGATADEIENFLREKLAIAIQRWSRKG